MRVLLRTIGAESESGQKCGISAELNVLIHENIHISSKPE